MYTINWRDRERHRHQTPLINSAHHQKCHFVAPLTGGWRIFDNSSCHNAMSEDALNVNHMNVNPGGSQRMLRDTVYNGREQKMYYMQGGVKVAKGLKFVLEERGVSTIGKQKEWMKQQLSQHHDFKFEKSEIEKYLIKKGTFLPLN